MTRDNFASGKGAADENFPVASRLVARRHRPVVMAFYAVARMADDVADHPSAMAADKLARLTLIEETLRGEGAAVPAAATLRRTLRERGLSDVHMLELLIAFRRDVTQSRYADWAELMEYCRYSAAPVGRFVLDVHGESRTTWAASDSLCAALQVINHLQDCGKDYRDLDRVYLPLDALGSRGLSPSALGAERGSTAMREMIAELAHRTDGLLGAARPLAGMVRDARLALEIGVIQGLAESLNRRLLVRDPLYERVHHRPIEAIFLATLAAAGVAGRRMARRSPGLAERAELGHS